MHSRVGDLIDLAGGNRQSVSEVVGLDGATVTGTQRALFETSVGPMKAD